MFKAGVSISGSSPRMWGTLLSLDDDPEEIRFIPTHVGNAALSVNLPSITSVHPHACGERKNALNGEP